MTNWNEIVPKITDETETISVGPGFTYIEYAVPAGKKWLITGFHITCVTSMAAPFVLQTESDMGGTKSYQVQYHNKVGGTAGLTWCPRGQNGLAAVPSTYNSNWIPIEVIYPGVVIMDWTAAGAGESFKTGLTYKEANT